MRVIGLSPLKTIMVALTAALLMIGVSVIIPSSGCVNAQISGVKGLEGYSLTSCCRKGCGGACCRCGSAAGYLSDCSTGCAVGLVEVMKLSPVTVTQAVNFQGRVVHAQNKSALEGIDVTVTLPGGATISTITDNNGQFIVRAGPASDTPINISAGDVLSLPINEIDTGEDKGVRLFVRRS